MPQRMYLIDHARVQLAGVDLGRPVRVRPNPKIGDVPLPARGIFAIGQAHWEILDEAEYHRTRAELGCLIRPLQADGRRPHHDHSSRRVGVRREGGER